MTRFLKKLHKWIGLLIGIQVLIWVLSGLVISLLDPLKVSGKKWKAAEKAQSQNLAAVELLEPGKLPKEHLDGALGIELTIRHGKPAYLVRHVHGQTLIDATDGSIVETTKSQAGELARRDFSGDGNIISIESGMAPDMETRGSNGAYWKVFFSDPANTAIYISASTGEILERRNTYWRVRDFFWMLHIMDYRGHDNFNNSIVISVVLIAAWLGISGFLLLFGTFKKSDFLFLDIPGKRRGFVMTLYDPMAAQPLEIVLRKGSNLYLSLATHGVNLPSVCGGGGECGKCRVRIETADLPIANDIELGLVPKRLREQNYRLACQQEVKNHMTIHVPGGTLTSGG